MPSLKLPDILGALKNFDQRTNSLQPRITLETTEWMQRFELYPRTLTSQRRSLHILSSTSTAST